MQAVEELRKSLPDEAIRDLIQGTGVTAERRDFAVSSGLNYWKIANGAKATVPAAMPTASK